MKLFNSCFRTRPNCTEARKRLSACVASLPSHANAQCLLVAVRPPSAVSSMRVDLSPRLGEDTVANQPPDYCPPLIHLHPPPRNGV